jgi:hypothetical protein
MATTQNNTTGKRRGVIASALALSVAATMALGVGTAAAADIGTNVSIQRVERPAQDVFKGFVTSPANKCIQDRTVLLMRVAPGADTRLDRDRSEDNGSWAIDVEGGAPAGQYYAKVRPKTVGADTCLGAKSARVTVP